MKFEIVDKKRCGEFINIFSNLKHFTDSISLMISEEKLYIIYKLKQASCMLLS